MKYTVLRDTREQKGWQFAESESCTGTVVQTLKTGDYSLLGYEDVFVVERKGSVAEFVQNITKKEKWEDFKAELTRLEAFPAAFIILEFDMRAIKRYPEGTNLPARVRKAIRVSPQFYLKRLLEIELTFKTKIILAGDEGRDTFSSLCKRVTEKWPLLTPPDSNARLAS